VGKTIGEKRNAYRMLMGRPERSKPLGRPRYRGWIILKSILEKWGGMV
jgi:hypothetical protein